MLLTIPILDPQVDVSVAIVVQPFGVSTKTLAQSLGANVGNGGFDPLYQLGGPRSIQLALKLSF